MEVKSVLDSMPDFTMWKKIKTSVRLLVCHDEMRS